MLLGLAVLALVSMVFGMMAAVSQDLPAIYNFAQYKASRNSVVVGANGEELGTLTSDQNKILLNSGQISPNVKNAVVSIEDSRFYEHSGVDFKGIGRALLHDILSQSAEQGASTITQQFVKQALEAESSRTVLEKFREAALAYRLERHWSKDKILTEYLNTVYFGEGAYGIEAAARTYFGAAHPGCGTTSEPCAALLEPYEAAMLAGIIQSPSAWDPKIYPENALARRNLVLEKMYEQDYISHEQMIEGQQHALPAPSSIEPPTFESKAPYFVAYLRQQLLERYGPSKAFYGGLKVKSTLDLQLQEAAEETVASYLGYLPATASVVVIDNRNAAIKALVGGTDFKEAPFNLATQGRRQPGSSIKPFTLLTALEEGISPATTYESAVQEFHFGKHGKETFVVHNDEDSYLGSCSIECATTYSDNSIYAQLGLEGLEGKTVEDRTRSIATTIHEAGYKDPISTNPAMVLGGLKEGVSPLGWAYAYIDDRQQRRPRQRHPRPRPRRQPRRLHRSDRQGRAPDQRRRQRLDPHPGLRTGNGRRREANSRNGRLVRHRHPRPDRGRRPMGQDRNDREQRRRLVLRRHRRPGHGLRLGRLPGLDDADDHPLCGRAGDGRHLPGPDLGRRDLGLAGHHQRTGGRSAGEEGGRKERRKGRILRRRLRRIRRLLRPSHHLLRTRRISARRSAGAGTGSARTGSRARPRSGAGRSRARIERRGQRRRRRARLINPGARASKRARCRRGRSARGAPPLW